MPILKDITNTIATAVLVAGMSTHALAQDATAENTADQDRPVATAQAGDAVQGVLPETSLVFRSGRIGDEMVEITPDVVQQYARQGRIKAPVAREESVASLQEFFRFRENRAQNKQAGIYIGVVVEDKAYTPLVPGYDGRDQFRAVHERVAELLTGYEAPKGFDAILGNLDEATKVPGYAELYGAEVQGIIPLRYQEGAEITYPGDTKAPIHVGDIIIMINDAPFPVLGADPEDEGKYDFAFPDNVLEMEALLALYLAQDVHRYAYAEHLEYEDTILAAAQNRYGKFFVMPASTDRVSGSAEGAGSGDGRPEITAIALSNN